MAAVTISPSLLLERKYLIFFNMRIEKEFCRMKNTNVWPCLENNKLFKTEIHVCNCLHVYGMFQNVSLILIKHFKVICSFLGKVPA